MSNINKTNVSKLAHQANFLIQQNKFLNSIVEEYKNQISLNNSYLQKYLHSTQPDCASILSNLNSYINELKQKHSHYQKKCKELKEKYETNISVIHNIIQPLKSALNKAKEDNFILKNELSKQNVILYLLNKDKSKLEDFAMFREEIRYLYTKNEEKVNTIMSEELTGFQEHLNAFSHKHNTEVNKIRSLDKERKNLISEIDIVSTKCHNNPTTPDIIVNKNEKQNARKIISNYSREVYLNKKLINTKEQQDFKENKNNDSYTVEIDEDRQDINESLFFKEFEDTYDEINQVDLYYNFDNKNSATKKKIYKTMVKSKHLSELPKLNLRQIEYNKIKVNIKDKEQNELEVVKKNKNRSVNKVDKEKEILSKKIEVLENKINDIHKKMKNNKKLIKKFKDFYVRNKHIVEKIVNL